MSSASLEKRSRVLGELLTTERSYVASLTAAEQHYMLPLYKRCGKSKEILSSKEIHILFGNLEQLATLNKKLLEDLEHEATKPAEQQAFGKLFQDFGPYFKMYTNYVHHHTEAIELLNELEGAIPNSSPNTKFIQFCQQVQLKDGLQSLRSLLITPVQRVPRYKLLLTELAKRTPLNHPDAPAVEEALRLVAISASHINEGVRRSENMLITAAIQELENVRLISPTRVFLRLGQVFIHSSRDIEKAIYHAEKVKKRSSRRLSMSHRSGDSVPPQSSHTIQLGKGTPYRMYLFNDALLLCRGEMTNNAQDTANTVTLEANQDTDSAGLCAALAKAIPSADDVPEDLRKRRYGSLRRSSVGGGSAHNNGFFGKMRDLGRAMKGGAYAMVGAKSKNDPQLYHLHGVKLIPLEKNQKIMDVLRRNISFVSTLSDQPNKKQEEDMLHANHSMEDQSTTKIGRSQENTTQMSCNTSFDSALNSVTGIEEEQTSPAMKITRSESLLSDGISVSPASYISPTAKSLDANMRQNDQEVSSHPRNSLRLSVQSTSMNTSEDEETSIATYQTAQFSEAHLGFVLVIDQSETSKHQSMMLSRTPTQLNASKHEKHLLRRNSTSDPHSHFSGLPHGTSVTLTITCSCEKDAQSWRSAISGVSAAARATQQELWQRTQRVYHSIGSSTTTSSPAFPKSQFDGHSSFPPRPSNKGENPEVHKSDQCELCSTSFNENRSDCHQCAKCHKNVCSTCSSYRWQLESDTEQNPSRVCSGCFVRLIQSRGGETKGNVSSGFAMLARSNEDHIPTHTQTSRRRSSTDTNNHSLQHSLQASLALQAASRAARRAETTQSTDHMKSQQSVNSQTKPTTTLDHQNDKSKSSTVVNLTRTTTHTNDQLSSTKQSDTETSTNSNVHDTTFDSLQSDKNTVNATKTTLPSSEDPPKITRPIRRSPPPLPPSITSRKKTQNDPILSQTTKPNNFAHSRSSTTTPEHSEYTQIKSKYHAPSASSGNVKAIAANLEKLFRNK